MGRLIFSDGWTNSNISSNPFSFGGVINGDTQLTNGTSAPTGWL